MYLGFLSLGWLVARVSPAAFFVSTFPLHNPGKFFYSQSVLVVQNKKTVVGMIRCVPPVSFWEASIHGECFVDERKIVYGGSISHLILDSMILALPLFELRKIHLNLWPKLGVIAIYICGGL